MHDVCRQFEEKLDAFVGGTLPQSIHRTLRQHAATCRRCGALLAVVLQSPETSDVASHDAPDDMPDSDLVGAVMQNTSGSACQRAQSLLCDWIDDTTRGSDAALLTAHLQHCAPCQQMETALRRLRVELPMLQEHRADARFVDDVLAATSTAAPARAATPGWQERLAQTWASLLQRPRFAWEVAWIGTALLVLLVGTPQSPLRDMPRSALAIVQTDPSTLWNAAVEPMERTWVWMRDDVEGAWQASGGRLVHQVDARRTTWLQEHPQVTRSWQSLQQRLPNLRRSIADGNLAEASWVLTGMGGDIGDLWHGLRADATGTTPTDAKETP